MFILTAALVLVFLCHPLHEVAERKLIWLLLLRLLQHERLLLRGTGMSGEFREGAEVECGRVLLAAEVGHSLLVGVAQHLGGSKRGSVGGSLAFTAARQGLEGQGFREGLHQVAVGLVARVGLLLKEGRTWEKETSLNKKCFFVRGHMFYCLLSLSYMYYEYIDRLTLPV